MINEANDHPRYAVDVQRDQSKPGHPHATIATITIHRPDEKARGNQKKQRKHQLKATGIPAETQLPKVREVEKWGKFPRKPSTKWMANLSKKGMSPTFGSRIGFNTMEESFSDSEGKV